ncbi:MAG: N-formylglutamate amidohydrolase [Hyphomonadaceae bacterium]|nr:N-formylglutamate amidohydrolase [Hyphomonadaceae bacterium]
MSDFEVATGFDGGDAPLFVFVDHASNTIPAAYDNLGLPDDILATHIGWDIGAAALGRALAERLQSKALFCQYSRLLIDPNRSLDKADLIPSEADRIPIPGNQALSAADRHQRIEAFHQPYHEQLELALDQICRAHTNPLIVSVHSFTPRLLGDAQTRPWHLGLLWREDEASARHVIQHLSENTDYHVGDNQPYDARVFNYSVDRHVGPRGLRHITLEVRQDLVSNTNGVDRVAGNLEPALQAMLKR